MAATAQAGGGGVRAWIGHAWERIHPDAQIGNPPQHRELSTAGLMGYPVELGRDVKIGACAVIDNGWKQPTRIGDRTWLMALTHVGHDCQVGADCEISTGAALGGHTVVGNNVRIGVNACTRPGITIGDGARIGCGAVVVKDVPAGETWVGNPARKLVESSQATKNYRYQATLEAALFALRELGCDKEEEAVADVLDRLYGWCSPNRSLAAPPPAAGTGILAGTAPAPDDLGKPPWQ